MVFVLFRLPPVYIDILKYAHAVVTGTVWEYLFENEKSDSELSFIAEKCAEPKQCVYVYHRWVRTKIDAKLFS